ncbi:ABC transporter ATP-binding protein [bacterium]|nr:ABC transporter ATP-binding protein [bacterium]
MFLKVENLKVEVNANQILKGINLCIKKGEIHALLGPNASGKSTLAQTISGNPKYKIVQGKIQFRGKNITNFSPEQRVKMGIALSWQNPPPIKGISLSYLLEQISQTKNFPFYKEWEYLMKREVNVNFSGGEKKISELLQVLALNPKLIIFDEIDSGLDIRKLKLVCDLIRKIREKQKISLLFITHWGQIMNYLKPDMVSVMFKGKIICQNRNFSKILKTIKKYGYEECKKCMLLAD